MQAPAFTKENAQLSEDFEEKLKVDVSDEIQLPKEEGESEEFSFVCMNPDGSPISADEVFQNGQIRPIFPIFDQSLLYRDDDEENNLMSPLRPPLRKLFMEDPSNFETRDVTQEEEPAGPFCEWSSSNKTVKDASPESCKKSNSTGFSKLWRFRELVLRSNSDGKDAFVFLNSNNNENTCKTEKPEKTSERPKKSSEKPEKSSKSAKTTTTTQKSSKGEKVAKVTGDNKKVKVETVSSLYEKHYVRNRMTRQDDKRKAYSPYRQDLFGFFTNVNGLSKNVHPY